MIYEWQHIHMLCIICKNSKNMHRTIHIFYYCSIELMSFYSSTCDMIFKRILFWINLDQYRFLQVYQTIYYKQTAQSIYFLFILFFIKQKKSGENKYKVIFCFHFCIIHHQPNLLELSRKKSLIQRSITERR